MRLRAEDWLRKSAVDAPSSIESIAQYGLMDTDAHRPCLQKHSLSAPLDPFVTALVGGLLFHRGPSAVFRRVWAIVVDAFDGIFITRTPAHVSDKCLKSNQPSIAHQDSSSAIVLKGLLAFIRASLPSAGPYSVFGPFSHSVFRSAQAPFNYQALATLARASFCKVPRRGQLFAAAITSASPNNVLPYRVSDTINRSQFSETFTRSKRFHISMLSLTFGGVKA